MKQSERGAAKVGVVWMVGALFAFFVAIVMFFLISQEAETQKARADAAEAKVAELEKKITTEVQGITSLSEKVGFYDPQIASRTELAAVEAGVKMLQESFPDAADAKTLEQAVKSAITASIGMKNRIKDLETQNGDLKTENAKKSENLTELTKANEQAIAAVRSQLADTEQAKNDQQADLERQLAEARDSLKDRDAKWRQSQASLEDSKRTYEREKEALRTRINEQGKKLNPFVKEPEAADGHILSVSPDLGLGWIDIGAKNRLAVGTRFRVVSGARGQNNVKGWAEVTRVDRDMAEVSFLDQKDQFDPPVAGDSVFNPLFDPTGERHAVLVGRFSGGINESELKNLLANMGVTVQKAVDKSTDFLIVGAEIFVDENGQPIENGPIAPSDLPVYKDAVADGVQIVQMKDLRQYFRF